MLFSTYSKNRNKIGCSAKTLSDIQTMLLKKIRSKGRFERLMEVLPENWENTFEIKFYNDPSEVSKYFCNEKHYKMSSTIFERTILSVIVNMQLDVDNVTGESRLKYPAVPSRYDEYYKRDYDYPVEENKWKFNHEMTELVQGSFHVDHKLIWTMKEREIDIDSEESIESVPYRYSINIYVPSEETIIESEILKLNDVQ